MRASNVWKALLTATCVAVLGGCSGADAAGDPAPANESANDAVPPRGSGGAFGASPGAGGVPGNGGKAASTGGGPSSGGPGSGGSSAGVIGPQPPGPPPGVIGPTEPKPDPAPTAVVNPFTIVAHDPLSTFAADVDTASYDLFTRSVGGGSLPAPSTVRTEEFVNYFDYAYPVPAPDAPDPFTISLSAAPGFFSDGTNVLRVGIQGKLAPAFEKKPANLVFLVDTSGSMQSPDKLPLVQRVLQRTLDVLEPTDTVSVVRYAGDVGVALKPTPVSSRDKIEAVIAALAASGGTNGGAGIELAYAQAQAGFIEEGINHVLLCTDGDFNIGISSTTELIKLIETKRRGGVTLTALGFGAVPNDAMMNAVSNAGNGIYAVITGNEQADRYVEERMLSTLVHIAKDVKIQVEWNPDAVYAYRLLGYETRDIADSDFRNDVVDAGEIGAGHRVTALYHVIPSGRSAPEVEGAAPVADGAIYDGPVEVKPEDMVLVKVRYKQPDAREADPAKEISARLAVADAQADLSRTDPGMQWAVALGTFSEILRGSPYVTPKEVLGPIGVVFERTAGTDSDRKAFLPLFTQARSLVLAR
jgi:Ca-activated chloride channel family protein